MKTNRFTKRNREILVSIGIYVDDKFAFDALQHLYEGQTDYEKQSKKTHDSNGVGFKHEDAELFTQVAEASAPRGYLTPEELAICRAPYKRGHGRPALGKYRRQLLPVPDEALVIHTVKRPAHSETVGVSEDGRLVA